jgi:hypothetical protein
MLNGGSKHVRCTVGNLLEDGAHDRPPWLAATRAATHSEIEDSVQRDRSGADGEIARKRAGLDVSVEARTASPRSSHHFAEPD